MQHVIAEWTPSRIQPVGLRLTPPLPVLLLPLLPSPSPPSPVPTFLPPYP